MDKSFVEKVQSYGLTVEYNDDFTTFYISEGKFHYSNRNDTIGRDMALAWCEIYKKNK
jgi:hypothetical protein